MNGTPSIRCAVEADAAAIAALHIRAWQWAYRGMLPDAYLDGMTEQIDRRTAWWRDLIGQPLPEHRTWVAERDQQIVGFARTGPSRDSDAQPGTAELGALYLEPDAVGTGAGRALMAHTVQDLRARGFPAATLWVLTANQRARRFYEIAGWHADGTAKKEHWPGLEFDEIRYAINLAAAENPNQADGVR